MKPKVSVIDYGVGNLLNVCRALSSAGADVEVIHTAEQVLQAERLVLPGVGAFSDCLRELQNRTLTESIVEFHSRIQRPFLGICVGMQLLFSESVEFGKHAGLGIIPGLVSKLEPSADHRQAKVPNIGWSSITPGSSPWAGTIFARTPPGTRFYFVHSYVGTPTQSTQELARAPFAGHGFTAACQARLTFGVQFHPERSGPAGLQVLSAFFEV